MFVRLRPYVEPAVDALDASGNVWNQMKKNYNELLSQDFWNAEKEAWANVILDGMSQN